MITQHSLQKVSEVIQLAEKKGVKLPLDDEMTDPWLEDFLYTEKKQEMSGRYLMDFEKAYKELARPNVTLTLLYDEYAREAHKVVKIPYAYRTFAENYGKYAKKYKVTMPIRRKSGEVLKIDWAGSTLFINDRSNEGKLMVYVFVTAFPSSQYSYVEGFLDMKSASLVNRTYSCF